ncbi:MAG: VanZ family protein [Magnetococcus sp. DMHC-6]
MKTAKFITWVKKDPKNLYRTLLLFYLFLLYTILPLTPVAVSYMYTKIGPSVFGIGVNSSLLALTLAGLGLLIYYRITDHWIYVLLPTICTALVIIRIEKAVERVHFLEYFIVGFLVCKSLRVVSWRLALWATFIVLSIGTLDEGIQGLLPNRYWDIRDLGMNAIGGGLGLWWARFVGRRGSFSRDPQPIPPANDLP